MRAQRKSSPERVTGLGQGQGKKARLKAGATPAGESAMPQPLPKGCPLPEPDCPKSSPNSGEQSHAHLWDFTDYFSPVFMSVVSAAHPRLPPSSMCLHKNNFCSQAKPSARRQKGWGFCFSLALPFETTAAAGQPSMGQGFFTQR